jgi:hypothetical protein
MPRRDTAKRKKRKTVKPQSEELESQNSVRLQVDDERDMKTILKELLDKRAVHEHLQILLENQLRNSTCEDQRQRRWNTK